MITVDKEGNVWTTDVALHVATKWSPAGTKLLELGQRVVPGHDKEHLCKPTQVNLTATWSSLMQGLVIQGIIRLAWLCTMPMEGSSCPRTLPVDSPSL